MKPRCAHTKIKSRKLTGTLQASIFGASTSVEPLSNYVAEERLCITLPSRSCERSKVRPVVLWETAALQEASVEIFVSKSIAADASYQPGRTFEIHVLSG